MKALEADAKVQAVVVGLGLIGGSLAARLKTERPRWHIVGVDADPKTVERAFEQGLVHEVAAELAQALASADFVVLAIPVGSILELLPTLGDLIPGECVVMDVGSTKAEIVQAMARLPERLQGIGGHPMTGATTAGVAGPSRDLFQGRRFVLCWPSTVRESTRVWARQLVADLGSESIELDAEEHDQAVAVVSHLPYLVSVSLLSTLEKAGEVPRRLAAGGFRSRVKGAGQNVPMWSDILSTNREGVAAALRAYRDEIERLEGEIRSGSVESFRVLLNQAAERAQSLESEQTR